MKSYIEFTLGDFDTATDELKWEIFSNWRFIELRETDWTQLTDVPLTPQQRNLWKTYRQELRDIPQKYAKVEDIVFPTRPQIVLNARKKK